jgi:putative tricarboxylic transport membrane protein
MHTEEESMSLHALRRLAAITAAVLAFTTAATAPAQSWKPDKPIEIVVSTGAGGSNDAVARAIQQAVQTRKLAATPLTVVNRAGGNQTIARAYVNSHPGDAHFMLMDNPTIIANRLLGLSQQQFSDFTPIALLVSEYPALTVKTESSIRDLPDMIERLKKDPESVSIGTSTRGSTNDLSLSLVAKAAGIDSRKLKIVIFKSNSEVITAVIGGHIDVLIGSVGTAKSQIAAGRARILALGAPQRGTDPLLVKVPTFREVGYDVSLANWRAFSGPRGLSAAQVAYWEETLAQVVETDEWKELLAARAYDPTFLRQREFLKFLEKDSAVLKSALGELGMLK